MKENAPPIPMKMVGLSPVRVFILRKTCVWLRLMARQRSRMPSWGSSFFSSLPCRIFSRKIYSMFSFFLDKKKVVSLLACWQRVKIKLPKFSREVVALFSPRRPAGSGFDFPVYQDGFPKRKKAKGRLNTGLIRNLLF